MRVVVSDSSIVIDLAKGELIEAALALPYEFMIPDALYESELIDLNTYEKEQLPANGMTIRGLTRYEVGKAIEYRGRYTALTPADAFALTIADETDDALLLTGDQNLRRAAQNEGIEAHGLLWVCEEMRQHGTVRMDQLHAALCQFRDDPTVWLPRSALFRLISKTKP